MRCTVSVLQENSIRYWLLHLWAKVLTFLVQLLLCNDGGVTASQGQGLCCADTAFTCGLTHSLPRVACTLNSAQHSRLSGQPAVLRTLVTWPEDTSLVNTRISLTYTPDIAEAFYSLASPNG